MHATSGTAKPILPGFAMQEIGSHKVFVYLSIPELKTKRSFRNFLKRNVSNSHIKLLGFQKRSFTFTINVQSKLYSFWTVRLPGEIRPERCLIKYKRDGCRITLIKLNPMPWTNKVCDNLNCELDMQTDNDQDLPLSTSPELAFLNDTNVSFPLHLAPLASSSSLKTIAEKKSRPLSSFNSASRASLPCLQLTAKKWPAPPAPAPAPPQPMVGSVFPVSSLCSQLITRKRPAPPPPPPINSGFLASSSCSQLTTKKRSAPPPPPPRPPINSTFLASSPILQLTAKKRPAPSQLISSRV